MLFTKDQVFTILHTYWFAIDWMCSENNLLPISLKIMIPGLVQCVVQYNFYMNFLACVHCRHHPRTKPMRQPNAISVFLLSCFYFFYFVWCFNDLVRIRTKSQVVTIVSEAWNFLWHLPMHSMPNALPEIDEYTFCTLICNVP